MKRLVPLVLALSLAACGYALAGRGNFLPDYIKIIGVPQFVNHSSTPDIDRVLTESVLAEFQTRRRYRVQPDVQGVDAILSGTINSVRVEAVAFTPAGQASQYAIIVSATVEFKEMRENKVLWSNPALQYRELYDVTTSTLVNDPAAFLASNSLAYERLAKNFARSVITSILEAF